MGFKTYEDFLILYYAFTKMVPPHIQEIQLLYVWLDLGLIMTSEYFIKLLLRWSHTTHPRESITGSIIGSMWTCDLLCLPNALLSFYYDGPTTHPG